MVITAPEEIKSKAKEAAEAAINEKLDQWEIKEPSLRDHLFGNSALQVDLPIDMEKNPANTNFLAKILRSRKIDPNLKDEKIVEKLPPHFEGEDAQKKFVVKDGDIQEIPNGMKPETGRIKTATELANELIERLIKKGAEAAMETIEETTKGRSSKGRSR
jgi:hypothetical protein